MDEHELGLELHRPLTQLSLRGHPRDHARDLTRARDLKPVRAEIGVGAGVEQLVERGDQIFDVCISV
jgi:hypothetical protein